MSREDKIEIRFRLNGEAVKRNAPIRQSLAAFLGTDLSLPGTRMKCDDGSCAACSIRLDGKVARACMLLAVQADKSSIVTIEALTKSGELADLTAIIAARGVTPCADCMPGQFFTAAELLAEGEPSIRDEIRAFMAGNDCACGSHDAMVDAIEATMKKRAGTA